MLNTSPSQTSDAEYQVENSQTEVEAIQVPLNMETPETETDIDLEFLYTRDIEFRQETIYFIVVDRFCDGNPQNNQGINSQLYDSQKKEWGKYWGGDLQGVINKLDYLKNMGVTAIWLTPLFEQVEELFIESAAIHGYWTKDFKRLNPRFIAPEDEIRPENLDRIIKIEKLDTQSF